MSSTVTTVDGEQATTTTETGEPDRCNCVWPTDVQREHVTIGRTTDGNPRRRVIETCGDCGGRVN